MPPSPWGDVLLRAPLPAVGPQPGSVHGPTWDHHPTGYKPTPVPSLCGIMPSATQACPHCHLGATLLSLGGSGGL